MKNILILGATGHLGQVLLKELLNKNFHVTALVRDKDKLNIVDKNLKIIEGQATNAKDLSITLKEIDVVISTLGHGFRTKFPVQEETMKSLVPLMEEKNIKRLITITGAGLKTKDDPNSLILNLSDKLLTIIDPYRINDSKAQQKILEESHLDWTVVRTPVHSNKGKINARHAGYNQPKPWQKISRFAVANFMIQIIEENKWIKKSPIIY